MNDYRGFYKTLGENGGTTRLPNEVMVTIFKYLSTEDLNSVAKTCFVYCDLASSILYETLSIEWKSQEADDKAVGVFLGGRKYGNFRQFLKQVVTTGSLSRILQYVRTFTVTHLIVDNIPSTFYDVKIENSPLLILLGWFVYILGSHHLPRVTKLDIIFAATIDEGPDAPLDWVINKLAGNFPNADREYSLRLTLLSNRPMQNVTPLKYFKKLAFHFASSDPMMIRRVCGSLPPQVQRIAITPYKVANSENLLNLFSGLSQLKTLTIFLSDEIQGLPHVKFIPDSVTDLVISERLTSGGNNNTELQSFSCNKVFPAKNIKRVVIHSNTGHSIRQFKLSNVQTLEYYPRAIQGSYSDDSYLKTFQIMMDDIKQSLVTLKLQIHPELLNSLITIFDDPYPKNLKNVFITTSSKFKEQDHQTSPIHFLYNSDTSHRFVQIMIEELYDLHRSALEFFGRHSPVYVYCSRPPSTTYCKSINLTKLSSRQTNWYLIKQQPTG